MAASDHLQGTLFGPEVGGTPPSVTERIKARAPGTPQHEGAFSVRESWENRGYTTFAAKADLPNTTDANHLKMFMTANEITDRYQVLDGDRQDSYDSYEPSHPGYTDSRAGEITGRRLRTDDVTNQTRYNAGKGSQNWRGGYDDAPENAGFKSDSHRMDVLDSKGNRVPLTGAKPYQRRQETAYNGNGWGGGTRSSTESDEQVYDRKYEEASDRYRNDDSNTKYVNAKGDTTDASGAYKYRDTAGNTRVDSQGNPQTGRDVHHSGQRNSHGSTATNGGSWETWHQHQESYQPNVEHPDSGDSMTEHLGKHGVSEPVRLGTQFGSQGKPEIVGGHHRIAVMRQDNPDALMPVIHDRDIVDARDLRSRVPNLRPNDKRRIKQGFPDYGKYT